MITQRKPWLASLKRWTAKKRRRWFRKIGGHHCPVCDRPVEKFLPAGPKQRANARCPECGSVERHRLIWLYLRERTDLFDGRHRRLLHVAPERRLARLFRQAENLSYVSIDLKSHRAMAHMDLTRMAAQSDCFDVIFCSHVLEHIPDDRLAMRELRRVLRPDGFAILQVPIKGEVTLEDPGVTSPEERFRLYGQDSHVRRYGRDYPERLRQAGFRVRLDRFAAELSTARARRFGLDRSEEIHLCQK